MDEFDIKNRKNRPLNINIYFFKNVLWYNGSTTKSWVVGKINKAIKLTYMRKPSLSVVIETIKYLMAKEH